MRRRKFLKGAVGAVGAAGAALLATCGRKRPTADRSKPSFLVLVTDDQRNDMMSCAGSTVLRTPEIDALAAQGTLFTNQFVTTSMCPTSRASIQTGQWASRHGVWGMWQPLSAASLQASYSAVLRAAGWRTGLVGKWGIGGPPPADVFDDYRGVLFSASYMRKDKGTRVFDTDLVTAQAVEFLRAAGPDPFCLTVCYKAPHGGRDPAQPGFGNLYADAEIPAPHAPRPGERGAAPAPLLATAGGESRAKRAARNDRAGPGRNYLRLIAGIDASVGTLRATLRELGADERTVIVFTSDNGLLFGEHALAGKWVAYEESIRVPLIVRDPAVPPAARGRREDRMTLNVDIAPTILERAGLPRPAVMQGTSVAPLVRGESPPSWREDWFYEFRALPGESEESSSEDAGHAEYESLKLPASEGVRTTRWKYVRYTDTDPVLEQLFDLAADPLEETDRSADPAAAGELERLRKRCAELKLAMQ